MILDKSLDNLEYPIVLTDHLQKNFSRSKKIWSIIIFVLSICALSYGLLYKNHLVMIIFSFSGFLAFIAVIMSGHFDDLVELKVDAKGIFISSDKNPLNRISLDWNQIDAILPPVQWASGNLDHLLSGPYASLFSSFREGGIVPGRHYRFEEAQAIICFRLPRRPEWREGREYRAYPITRLFGLSQAELVAFLRRHLERNRPSQVES